MIQGKSPLYYKCQFCGKFEQIIQKRKKYCSTSCTMKAYYRRKLAKQAEDEKA